MRRESATGLPPGPRLPRWIQTAGFILQPSRWIDANRRRYGDVVTFRSLFDPCFVMVFDPEIAKQVFRGSPDQLRAGEANAVLGPVVGRRSVLLLDGAEHLRERKLLLPPFHGERMRAYERVMTRGRRPGDRLVAGGPRVHAPPLAALAHPRRDPARGVRGGRGAAHGGAQAPAPGDDRPDLHARWG